MVHQHAEIRPQGGPVGLYGHAAGEHFRQPAAVSVVDVDDGHGFSPGSGVLRHLFEQFRLGLEIILHSVVVVQVVLGQIGENAHVEIDAGHAFLVQRVGRDLHGDAAAAVFIHFLQQVFQFQRSGRGMGGRGDFLSVVIGDGADQSGAQPGLLEQGMGDVGRRSFSVRPRHADHGHVAGRASVPGRAHQADGQAGIVHLHPADSGLPGFLRAGHFRDDGACSAANGLRDEFMAIRPGPLQGNVAGTGQNAPAVALQM